MLQFQHDQDIALSKSDELIRQNMIRHYKPYIINTVGHICKRFVTWSDEESSIGLLAFNRAIDNYDPHRGKPFLGYAYMLINRDLINYFRHNKKLKHLSYNNSAEDEKASTIIELQISMESYYVKKQKNDLVEEILELNEQLNHFGIGFEELEEASPKHRDTRTLLHQMVFQFMQYDDLKDELLKKKRFPMSVFRQRTGYSPKTLERYRKYLITLIIINLHPNCWVNLSSYKRMGSEKGER